MSTPVAFDFADFFEQGTVALHPLHVDPDTIAVSIEEVAAAHGAQAAAPSA